jgi:hypothetical protein
MLQKQNKVSESRLFSRIFGLQGEELNATKFKYLEVMITSTYFIREEISGSLNSEIAWCRSVHNRVFFLRI